MIAQLLETIVRVRWLIGAALVAGVVASIYAVRTAPLDAIPDTSDPQVVVYAKWARSPELLESEVTEPIVKALLGSPEVRSIRATSHMGYSFIYAIAQNATQRSALRQLVTDRLNAIRQQLPPDATVSVGPNASGIGWIYEYALIDNEQLRDPRELRLLNDNLIKPAVQTVPGVAEVASVGGLEKQYQLKVFPPLLADAGLSLKQLVDALQSALQEAGGRTIEVTNRDYQIRGIVSHDNIDELEALVIGHTKDGKAVAIKDIGYIQVGYDQRRGIAELNGEGEVVGGIVIMEQAQNAIEITRALKARIAEIGESLPSGVEIVPTYDRSQLIWGTLKHFFLTLLYELGVVIVVTVLFLRNLRTAIAPVTILLLGVLFTALPMSALHQTINLFSLAGLFIAIGEMVDATIVIVENCTAELASHPNATEAERRKIVLGSIASVARPLLFSLLIILASFLPVFFLSDKEARLFDPLAFTKTFAMAFSTLLTLFLLPILMLWVFRGRPGKPHGGLELAFISAYRSATKGVVRYRYAFLAVNVALLVGAIVIAAGLSARLHAAARGRLDPLYADYAAGRADQGSGLGAPADGQEARGVPGGRERVRQARPSRHGDRLRARVDDRDDDSAQGPEANGAPGSRRTTSSRSSTRRCRSSAIRTRGCSRSRRERSCRTPASRRPRASRSRDPTSRRSRTSAATSSAA